jgi:hypothetical protein
MKSANYENLCELSGFDGSDHEHFSLLGYCAAQSRWSRHTFQRCVLPPSSGRWRPEMSVYFNEITWRNIPQGWNLYENLLVRFLTILLFFLSLTECSKWDGICRYTIPKRISYRYLLYILYSGVFFRPSIPERRSWPSFPVIGKTNPVSDLILGHSMRFASFFFFYKK